MFSEWMFKTVDIARACSKSIIVDKWVRDKKKAGRQAGIILEMGERVGLRLKLLPHQLNFDTGQHLRSL